MNPPENNILQNQRIQKMLYHVPLLLRNFPPEELRAFVQCGYYSEYETGERIQSNTEGFVNDGFLVVDGNISIFLQDVFIGKLRAGDFIGETFLLKGAPSHGTLFATSPSALLRYKKKNILDFFEKRSDRLFKMFIMNLLELQQNKLNYASQKILRLQKKLIQLTN